MRAATFELIEFNQRRLARAADAARVEYNVDGVRGWVWMSKSDVEKNIREFGKLTGLVRAREAYKLGHMPTGGEA